MKECTKTFDGEGWKTKPAEAGNPVRKKGGVEEERVG